MCDAHIEDNRMVGPRERVPIKRFVIKRVAGCESYAMRKLSVGQRNPCRSRRAQRRGYSGHDDVANASRRERLDLFAAAAKYERIAALQARDAQAGARIVNQKLVDARLRRLRISSLLADKDALRIAAGACQYRIRYQPIIEYDVGLLQQLHGAQREQIRVSRTRTDQVHLTERGRRGRY